MNMNQVQPPSAAILSQALNVCSQTLVVSTANNQIYRANQTYSIDICGNSVSDLALNQLNNALLSAWLEARPGKFKNSKNKIILAQVNFD